MSKLLKGILCLTIAVAFVAPALADDSFEYHGYARMGQGTNVDLVSQAGGLQAPGADTKYRLGNEPNDSYIENKLVKNWKGEGDEYAKFVFLGAWTNDQSNNWGSGTTGVVREAYAEIGDMAWAPGVSFWAGERFYMRRDVHITDFYYRDNSGWGGGVTGIAVGPAKLNIAYIGQRGGSTLYEDENDAETQTGQQMNHNFDIIVNDLDLGFANLELEYIQMYQAKGYYDTDGDGTPETETETPFSFVTNAFIDFKSFFGIGGSATIGVQYGQGYGSQSLAANWAYSGTQAKDSAIKDAYKFRALFTGVAQVTADLSIMPLLVYQLTDNGADSESKRTWISAGFRAKQMLNKNFGIQLEYGMDYVKSEASYGQLNEDQDDGISGMIHKVTIAPTLQLAPGFWTRPEVRAYVTYAKWTGDFNNYASDNNGDGDLLDAGETGQGIGRGFEDTYDVQFGLQAEAWW